MKLHPYKLEAIFKDYIIDLISLRETFFVSKEFIEDLEGLPQNLDSYKHLSTEKAFSLFEQIKAIDLTLKQTDSLQELERNVIINIIMKPIDLAIQ